MDAFEVSSRMAESRRTSALGYRAGPACPMCCDKHNVLNSKADTSRTWCCVRGCVSTVCLHVRCVHTPQAVNWLNTASPVDGDAALLDFTCPGTAAAQYKSCRTASEAGGCADCRRSVALFEWRSESSRLF